MDQPSNPLSRLSQKELVWIFGILKDACRERLEKNLVSQAFEERLHQRGGVEGRLDPRPFLKIWEPRYRKFLDVALDIHARLQAENAREFAAALREQFDAEAERKPIAPARPGARKNGTRRRRAER